MTWVNPSMTANRLMAFGVPEICATVNFVGFVGKIAIGAGSHEAAAVIPSIVRGRNVQQPCNEGGELVVHCRIVQ